VVAAYGLIALAVVAFVVLYAAAHAPSFKTVNLADQLYGAKGWLASNLPSFPRVDVASRFRVFVNVVRVVKANAAAYDYRHEAVDNVPDIPAGGVQA
jgi:hypothetical protein